MTRGTSLSDTRDRGNRGPQAPLFCGWCRRGALPGEAACACGARLMRVPTVAESEARKRRRAWTGLIVVGSIGVVAALVAGLVVSADTTTAPGPSGPGRAVAAQACSTFRAGLQSAAAGTATNADADKTISASRKNADAAATLNSVSQPLLVMLTAEANGGETGRPCWPSATGSGSEPSGECPAPPLRLQRRLRGTSSGNLQAAGRRSRRTM